MERYGQTPVMEGSQSDPLAEWSSPGAETGLEEPMWQLGLGGGGESYPERPGEANCIYFLRTGFCGFGARCRFNHPRDRSVAVGAMRAAGGEYPERVGQPVCKYYMRTGMCKFGASCKYHHPSQGGEAVSPVALNISGYPLRPGEKECLYYVRTGQCKFGVSCKFHHPQLAGIQVPAPAPGPLPPAASLLAPAIYPTAPGSAVASSGTQPNAGGGPIYGITQLSPSAPAYAGPNTSTGPSGGSQKEHTFPERPGQPECQYYMKKGDCKFGSSCRYHHPPESSMPKTNFGFNSMGLPLRPGAPLCSHYAQNGVCKFGTSCKFDHPTGTLSYSPSASSLADMPVAPYPVGSSIGTLAPSSSSSDLRPELVSGSNKDTVPTRMSSSVTMSSGPVGSIFSKSGPVPHSSDQQSGKSSTPSTVSSSTGQGGEVSTSR
ncbi:zinc finger CCCH domain-containing protein 58-like isoform X2 [Cornus florida]|uniref:zinc finger CCCH domain-containing protein 58-like isoform X2 n=1 Tax=Cornus florida TaxID=4283 RepID=UPI002896D497|nr:zinc finger CCCH domain-containing protein 58-like isoform X2 [Cornus florida]